MSIFEDVPASVPEVGSQTGQERGKGKVTAIYPVSTRACHLPRGSATFSSLEEYTGTSISYVDKLWGNSWCLQNKDFLFCNFELPCFSFTCFT